MLPNLGWRRLHNTDDDVAVMTPQVRGNFMFDAATHRDFLGAVLGTGIDRRTVGDVLVQGEQGAQVLCAPEITELLEGALTSVRLRSPVLCAAFEPSGLPPIASVQP